MTLDEHFSIDIHGTVRVRLNATGRHIMRNNYHRRLEEHMKHYPNGVMHPFRPVEEDAEGWSEWRWLDLMKEFGPHLGWGKIIPFDRFIKAEGVRNADA